MPVMRNSEEPWTIKNPDCGSGGRWFESTQLYQQAQRLRVEGLRLTWRRVTLRAAESRTSVVAARAGGRIQGTL